MGDFKGFRVFVESRRLNEEGQPVETWFADFEDERRARRFAINESRWESCVSAKCVALGIDIIGDFEPIRMTPKACD